MCMDEIRENQLVQCGEEMDGRTQCCYVMVLDHI